MRTVFVMQWFTGQHNVAVYSTLLQAKQAVLALLYAYNSNTTPTFTRVGRCYNMDQQLHGLEHLTIVEHDLDPGCPFGVLLDF